MADVTIVLEPVPSADIADVSVTVDPFTITRTYEILPIKTAFVPDVNIYQRIFNLTSGQFHYYTATQINTNPAAGDVEPVAPDTNWDAGRHAVVELDV